MFRACKEAFVDLVRWSLKQPQLEDIIVDRKMSEYITVEYVGDPLHSSYCDVIRPRSWNEIASHWVLVIVLLAKRDRIQADINVEDAFTTLMVPGSDFLQVRSCITRRDRMPNGY